MATENHTGNKLSLRQFLGTATLCERELIAKQCHVPVKRMQSIASGWRRVRLDITEAVALDEATRRLRIANHGRTPHVTIFDLVAMTR